MYAFGFHIFISPYFFSYCFSQNIIIFATNISCAHLKIFLKHLKFEGKLKTPRKKFQPLIVIYVYRNYDHGSANSSLKFIEKSKIEIKYWRTISIVDEGFWKSKRKRLYFVFNHKKEVYGLSGIFVANRNTAKISLSVVYKMYVF